MGLQKTRNSLEKETKNLDSDLFNAQGKGCFDRYAKFLQLKEDINKKLDSIIKLEKEYHSSINL